MYQICKTHFNLNLYIYVPQHLCNLPFMYLYIYVVYPIMNLFRACEHGGNTRHKACNVMKNIFEFINGFVIISDQK